MPYKNKADQDARNRRYYAAHKDAIKAYAKKWFLENEGKQTEKIQAWRKENRDKVRAYCKRWKKRNKSQYLASERKRKRVQRARKRGETVKTPNAIQSAARLLKKAVENSRQAKYGISGRMVPGGF